MPGFKETVLGVIGNRLMTQARVADVEIISNQFRLISLSSEKFKIATVTPAARIRINAGSWQMRAYTPLSIDAVVGHVQILAYLHGTGPGSNWARSAVSGNLTQILGPQQSLELLELSQPAVFFGDETSFAAAKTLQSHLSPRSATRFIFEISNTEEAHAVFDRLELRDTQCFERQPDGAHLPLVTEAIQQALSNIATPHLILTGNGRSIQAVRAGLRAGYSDTIKHHVKAYWAPGKTGLE